MPTKTRRRVREGTKGARERRRRRRPQRYFETQHTHSQHWARVLSSQLWRAYTHGQQQDSRSHTLTNTTQNTHTQKKHHFTGRPRDTWLRSAFAVDYTHICMLLCVCVARALASVLIVWQLWPESLCAQFFFARVCVCVLLLLFGHGRRQQRDLCVCVWMCLCTRCLPRSGGLLSVRWGGGGDLPGGAPLRQYGSPLRWTGGRSVPVDPGAYGNLCGGKGSQGGGGWKKKRKKIKRR